MLIYQNQSHTNCININWRTGLLQTCTQFSKKLKSKVIHKLGSTWTQFLSRRLTWWDPPWHFYWKWIHIKRFLAGKGGADPKQTTSLIIDRAKWKTYNGSSKECHLGHPPQIEQSCKHETNPFYPFRGEDIACSVPITENVLHHAFSVAFKEKCHSCYCWNKCSSKFERMKH